MSKRHTSSSIFLKKSSGRKVADKDITRIWNNVNQVWHEYPSSAIARGHILAYRLIKKALEIDGGSDYLGDGLNCNVRRDLIHCVNLRLRKILN